MGNYKLPTWQAVGLSEVVLNGHTQPLILNCIGSNPEDGLTPIFVKALDPPSVDHSKLIREIFGCVLARRLGLRAPSAYLVEIGREAAELITEATQSSALPREVLPGIAAGFEFIPGLMPGLGRLDPTHELMKDFASLFAFDMTGQNEDRTPYNENCAIHAGRLLAFDFGSCFENKVDLSLKCQPWEFAEQDLAVDHLMRPYLHRRKTDWSSYCSLLQTLTEPEIEEIAQSMPLSWRGDLVRVACHIIKIVDNISLASDQLSWCLI